MLKLINIMQQGKKKITKLNSGTSIQVISHMLKNSKQKHAVHILG